jgi:hypothetical protein
MTAEWIQFTTHIVCIKPYLLEICSANVIYLQHMCSCKLFSIYAMKHWTYGQCNPVFLPRLEYSTTHLLIIALVVLTRLELQVNL